MSKNLYKDPNRIPKPYIPKDKQRKSVLEQEEDLDQSFDSLVGEEQGVALFDVHTQPLNLQDELADITNSIKEMSRQIVETKEPLAQSQQLNINDIHKMFMVNRFSSKVDNGPRNFYDHSHSIAIKDLFLAQLNINKNRSITNIGDIREELRLLDQDNDAKRVVGTITDLNKDAYALMKKTHDREKESNPGDLDVINKHALERNYFKYRMSLDEPKKDISETRTNQAHARDKLLLLTHNYIENNPSVKELMRIEKSLLPNSSKSSKWKEGLRNFYGNKPLDEMQAFDAENQMISMQNWNSRNVSQKDRPTFLHHVRTERAVFNYKQQEVKFNKNPSNANESNLSLARDTLFKVVADYEMFLAKKPQQSINDETLKPSKPRTLEDVENELKEAQGQYGGIVARGNIEEIALAHLKIKSLEDEHDSKNTQKFNLSPIQEELLNGLKNGLEKRSVINNINKLTSNNKKL